MSAVVATVAALSFLMTPIAPLRTAPLRAGRIVCMSPEWEQDFADFADVNVDELDMPESPAQAFQIDVEEAAQAIETPTPPPVAETVVEKPKKKAKKAKKPKTVAKKVAPAAPKVDWADMIMSGVAKAIVVAEDASTFVSKARVEGELDDKVDTAVDMLSKAPDAIAKSSENAGEAVTYGRAIFEVFAEEASKLGKKSPKKSKPKAVVKAPEPVAPPPAKKPAFQMPTMPTMPKGMPTMPKNMPKMPEMQMPTFKKAAKPEPEEEEEPPAKGFKFDMKNPFAK